ncbi:hypothetical protein E2C01_061920 [Portunus trituberculatus]|uniref:Uncharacterized protein n=1 Tax=Portunus trituberculatus TaxID=210409 RepID=A0A5B7HEJ2_PORTR|nr:hypothetical protein [Portunus trituberculatus]
MYLSPNTTSINDRKYVEKNGGRDAWGWNRLDEEEEEEGGKKDDVGKKEEKESWCPLNLTETTLLWKQRRPRPCLAASLFLSHTLSAFPPPPLYTHFSARPSDADNPLTQTFLPADTPLYHCFKHSPFPNASHVLCLKNNAGVVMQG